MSERKWNEWLRAHIKEVLKEIGIEENQTVLDFGCGSDDWGKIKGRLTPSRDRVDWKGEWLVASAWPLRHTCGYDCSIRVNSMNPIDYSQLRTLTLRKLLRALRRNGFTLERQKGSYQHYSHPDGQRVMVSFHQRSDTFPPKTLKSIIETQARWRAAWFTLVNPSSDLRRLRLFKT